MSKHSGMPSRFWQLLTRSSFVRHLSVMFIANFGVIGLSFLTGALSARLLGPEGRGALAEVQLWALLLASLGSLDIPKALTYYVSKQEKDVNNTDKISQLISAAWWGMILLSPIWLMGGYFALPFLLNTQDEALITLARFSLLLIPMGYANQVSSALLGMKLFNDWAFLRLLNPLLYAFMLIAFGLMNIANVVTIAFGFLITSITIPIVTYILFWMRAVRPRLPRWEDMYQMLNYGLRSILGTIPDALNARLDQAIIAAILPQRSLGLYVVAVSWSLIPTGIFRAVGTLILPYVAGETDPESQSRLLVRSMNFTVIIAIVIAVAMGLVTPFALPFFFGVEFADAIPTAIVLIVSTIFFNLKFILANGLRGLGYPGVVGVSEGIALIANFILLFFLLPLGGIMAAALISVVSYALSFAIMLGFVWRHLNVRLTDLLLPSTEDIRTLWQLLLQARKKDKIAK